MLVAQCVTQLEAQANQVFFFFFHQFLDFDNQHIAQIDLGNKHLLAGFVIEKNVAIFQESVARQRNRDVITIFASAAQTVFFVRPTG